MKEKVFSLTHKDFKFDTFTCPGHGGQHGDKANTGVRITHKETGYSSRSTEFRTQHQNKKKAFEKLCSQRLFKAWLKTRALKIKTIDEIVDDAMLFENLKVEIRQDGKWVQSPVGIV